MKVLRNILIIGAALACFAQAGQAFQFTEMNFRSGYAHKGDLFVWPHVKIRWDDASTPGNPADDTLLEDTFISVVNDDTTTRYFKMFFVDGASWRYSDRRLELTGNQPGVFSAYRGSLGFGGVPPFLAVHPLGYQNGPNTYNRQLSGFIVGWTVDVNNVPYGVNQLAASATVVNYEKRSAWEYKPWAFRSFFEGPKPDPTRILLNGQMGEYQLLPSHLMLDFFAAGSKAFGKTVNDIPSKDILQDFELTLLTMKMDFRSLPDFDLDGTPGELPVAGGSSEDSEPPTTAVTVLAWNENESQVSNTVRCVTCWDSKLASAYGYMGAGSPFAQSVLQTNKGKARLTPGRDMRCDRAAGSPNAQILIYSKVSKDLPIIGIAHKTLTFNPDRVPKAVSYLVPMGDRTDGYILFDQSDQGTPPTLTGGTSARGIEDLSSPQTPRQLRSR